VSKFEQAFTQALKARGFLTAKPIPVGKGVSRRMFIERGSQVRRDLPAAVLEVLRRG
jgi:hypothetical protein